MHFEGDEQNSSTVVTTELEPVQEATIVEKSEKTVYELSSNKGQTLDDLMPSYYRREEIDLEKINIAPSHS